MTRMKRLGLFVVLTVVGVAAPVLLGSSLFSSPAEAAGLPKLNVQESALSPSVRAATSLAPIVKQVAPSVVNIYTTKRVREVPLMLPFFDDPFFRRFFDGPGGLERVPRERRQQALGSGVIVSEDGYILTANHVVDGADEIKVALADEKTVLAAKIVGTDPQTDIAVLKVEGRKLPAIAITDSDKVEVGDLVLAIGNPFGVGQTVTAGIVSAKGRSGMGIVDYEDFIQTDASINPGNSGGALVDAEGRLVGINTAILSRTGGNLGIGFAVPINLARYVMERLITEGKVTRGWLGVVIQPVTEALAREFKLKEPAGALVGEVTPNSPAEAAGLKEGDVIVQFNGRKVTDSRQLRLMVAQTAPGTKATLKIIREGKEQTLTAKLGELQPDRLALAGRGGRGSEAKNDPFRGVDLADVDNRTRGQFDIPSQVRGAVVLAVEPDCPGAEAGLRPGDVIIEINRQRIHSAEEALALGRRYRGARVLVRVWREGGSRYVVIDTTRSN